MELVVSYFETPFWREWAKSTKSSIKADVFVAEISSRKVPNTT